MDRYPDLHDNDDIYDTGQGSPGEGNQKFNPVKRPEMRQSVDRDDHEEFEAMGMDSRYAPMPMMNMETGTQKNPPSPKRKRRPPVDDEEVSDSDFIMPNQFLPMDFDPIEFIREINRENDWDQNGDWERDWERDDNTARNSYRERRNKEEEPASDGEREWAGDRHRKLAYAGEGRPNTESGRDRKQRGKDDNRDFAEDWIQEGWKEHGTRGRERNADIAADPENHDNRDDRADWIRERRRERGSYDGDEEENIYPGFQREWVEDSMDSYRDQNRDRTGNRERECAACNIKPGRGCAGNGDEIGGEDLNRNSCDPCRNLNHYGGDPIGRDFNRSCGCGNNDLNDIASDNLGECRVCSDTGVGGVMGTGCLRENMNRSGSNNLIENPLLRGPRNSDPEDFLSEGPFTFGRLRGTAANVACLNQQGGCSRFCYITLIELGRNRRICFGFTIRCIEADHINLVARFLDRRDCTVKVCTCDITNEVSTNFRQIVKCFDIPCDAVRVHLCIEFEGEINGCEFYYPVAFFIC